jgi:hypothetical protein
MTRRFILIVVAAVVARVAFASVAEAQSAPAISVSAGTHISGDSPNAPFVESFDAINPVDPKNVIATSIVGTNGSTGSRVYASRDGGRTWQRARMRAGTDQILDGLDPVVYFDSSGTGFLATSGMAFLVSRSTDGGFTWESSVMVPGGNYDREYLGFDNTAGKYRGRIYAGGTISLMEASGKPHQAIAITFSIDGGRTFSSPSIVTGDWSGGEGLEMCDLLVSPDGELVVPFETSPDSSSPHSSHSGRLGTFISEDGGLTFSPARLGPSTAESEGFRMLKSLVAPHATIDTTKGIYGGRIYLSWTDFDGKKYVVKVARSSDLGKTWLPPVIVNDNASQGDPANPVVAVNRDGVLGVAFNDRRDDPENSCFRLYFSASVDGGETFLPNVKAAEQRTCPAAPGNWAATASSFLPPTVLTDGKPRPVIAIGTIADRWPNGGDTLGLVASPDGVFYSAWINGESGVMQLWWKEIAVDRDRALGYRREHFRKDLSGELALEVSEATIDFTKHVMSVTVRLVNPLTVAFTGPFTIVLHDSGGSLKGLRAVNSDNGMSGRGAAWSFTVKGKRSLEPQQKSDERVFRWEFVGTPPEENQAPFFGHFVILGEPR